MQYALWAGRLLQILLVSLLVITSASAVELQPKDKEKMLERATLIRQAFDRNDTDTIIKMTHPAIFKLTNGKEGYEKLMRSVTAQLKEKNVTISESSLEPPSSAYTAGDETVCFIPRLSIITIDGKKIKSTGFLIAARSPGGEWLFLDGAGLRKNPGLLKMLFPQLPDDVKLPANHAEIMK